MSRWETFEAFLTNQRVEISIGAFAVNLALAALLAWLLSRVYVRYAGALSNRRAFASNFVLLTTTTTLIISIVKSSLALSLGLVGALSIVRFRAAIKEPEELAYLFLTIAIGLGLGADQRVVTLFAFAVIAGLLVARGTLGKRVEQPNLYLSVSGSGPARPSLDDVVRVLRDHCTALDLKRFDEDGDALEASFVVDYDSFEKMTASKAALLGLSDRLRVSFLDNRGAL